MDKITLGQIALALAFIVGLWASIDTIVKKVSTATKKALDEALKPTNDKIDVLSKKIDTVDLNSTKNFLLSRIEEAKTAGIDDITKFRVLEQWEHYKALGGNSYISGELEKLKKENKL